MLNSTIFDPKINKISIFPMTSSTLKKSWSESLVRISLSKLMKASRWNVFFFDSLLFSFIHLAVESSNHSSPCVFYTNKQVICQNPFLYYNYNVRKILKVLRCLGRLLFSSMKHTGLRIRWPAADVLFPCHKHRVRS